MKSVCYFVSTNGACDYYRAELPWRTAKKNGVDVRRIMKGDNARDIEKAADGADVCLFQRVDNEPMLEIMARLKNEGRKIVVDWDDNIFHVSPFSPHYEDYGTENVKVEVGGELVDLWQHGVGNFDVERNAYRVECIKAAVSLADTVTVTTDILADAYRAFNQNVTILPNCVDPALWQRLPLKEDGTIRIYWSGGSSHFEDFALLTEPLKEIAEKYPQTRLVTMGQEFKGVTKSFPSDRVEHHSWVDTAAYPYKTAILNPTISLIPLADNDFNRCKSSIKFIEQSTLGTPSIVSYVSPYKEDYNGNNGVFVKGNTPEGWFKAVSAMIEDPILRANIAGEAQKSAEKYDINNRWPDWVKAYGLN